MSAIVNERDWKTFRDLFAGIEDEDIVVIVQGPVPGVHAWVCAVDEAPAVLLDRAGYFSAEYVETLRWLVGREAEMIAEGLGPYGGSLALGGILSTIADKIEALLPPQEPQPKED